MAEFAVPQAGKTVAKRFKETSQYTAAVFGLAKGHTPPTGWPVRGNTSSALDVYKRQL